MFVLIRDALGDAVPLRATTGDLSIAGKTKSVTIAVEHVGDGEFRGARRGYMTNFAIKRSDFGMTYGVKQNVLGDDVHLTVSLELAQPK